MQINLLLELHKRFHKPFCCAYMQASHCYWDSAELGQELLKVKIGHQWPFEIRCIGFTLLKVENIKHKKEVFPKIFVVHIHVAFSRSHWRLATSSQSLPYMQMWFWSFSKGRHTPATCDALTHLHTLHFNKHTVTVLVSLPISAHPDYGSDTTFLHAQSLKLVKKKPLWYCI